MLSDKLLHTQWRQLNHDELYHREIARLSVGDKMKHMTLHPSHSSQEHPQMACLILGDSIAVGLSAIVKGCYVSAAIGAPSVQILAATPYMHVDYAFISSGSNDPTNPSLLSNLKMTRARINSANVTWLVPINPQAASTVRQAGLMHDDRHVAFVPGPDNIHPRSYYELARDATEGNRH
jgi:hypothetical protein